MLSFFVDDSNLEMFLIASYFLSLILEPKSSVLSPALLHPILCKYSL